MTTHPPETMQCMEVWGGNRAIEQSVVMPGLELWVYAQPYEGDESGGDVHYVSSCGTGRISRLVVADVSGHGERVAAVALGLRTLMRRFVNYLDQTRFVDALNKGLLATDDSGRFATSVTMTFFAPSRQLDVCNAGHPRPLWYRALLRRWEWLVPMGEAAAPASSAPANLPLGILEPTRYEEFGVALERGDLVLMYTDAVVEAKPAAAPASAMLGEAGLLRIANEIDASRPEEFLSMLRTKLTAWREGAPADDDTTLLLLRHDGVRRQAPLHERLWASVRFLGLLARAAWPFGERTPIPWPEPSKHNILGALSRRVSETWRGVDGKRAADR